MDNTKRGGGGGGELQLKDADMHFWTKVTFYHNNNTVISPLILPTKCKNPSYSKSEWQNNFGTDA